MEDYQFQHEQSPELQKQAVDAVNRTLWLEHWKLAPYKLYAAAWGYIPFVGPRLIDYILDHWLAGTHYVSKEPFRLSDIPIILLMLSSGAIWFIVFLKLISKTERLKRMNKLFETPRKTQWILLILVFLPALFFGVSTFSHRMDICIYLSVLVSLTMTWFEFRKLRKSLINWGVIEDARANEKLDHSPLVQQLSQAEAIVDQNLGVPIKRPVKKRLFARAKPI